MLTRRSYELGKAIAGSPLQARKRPGRPENLMEPRREIAVVPDDLLLLRRFRPMDVLIVEQDKLLAEVLAAALSEAGLDVTVAADDMKAVECCERDVPAIVITGMNRLGEDMGGLHLVRAMRRRWCRIGAVYIAALWPTQLHRCALALCERFLPKPISINKFVQTVRELLPG